MLLVNDIGIHFVRWIIEHVCAFMYKIYFLMRNNIYLYEIYCEDTLERYCIINYVPYKSYLLLHERKYINLKI